MLDFYIPKFVNKIGLRISGGADSAIVSYALAHHIAVSNKHIEIIPITVLHDGKAYQKQYADKILDFIKQKFDINIGSHYTAFSTSIDYIEVQNNLTNSLYKKNIIDAHFIGITKNPPAQFSAVWEEKYNLKGPVDDRDTDLKTFIVTDENHIIYRPLKDKDKKDVAQLYKDYGVLDTLFPLTRSCEEYTVNFEQHCGKCWFCQERLWGFGKL